MSLEDKCNEDDEIESSDEKITFVSEEDFNQRLISMSEKSRKIKAEGLLCSNCAAYPCYRSPFPEDGLEKAGLCF